MLGFENALSGSQSGQQLPKTSVEPKQATPEQMAEYNQFVGHAMLLLWDEEFIPQGVELLEAHPDVADAIANIAVVLIQRILAGALEQGHQMSLEVLLHGGKKIVEEVGEFAEASGAQGVNDEVLEDAFYNAADKMRPYLQGKGFFSDADVGVGEEAIRQQFGDEPIRSTGERLGKIKQRTEELLLSKPGGVPK